MNPKNCEKLRNLVRSSIDDVMQQANLLKVNRIHCNVLIQRCEKLKQSLLTTQINLDNHETFIALQELMKQTTTFLTDFRNKPLQQINQKQTREEFVEFFQRFYHQINQIIESLSLRINPSFDIQLTSQEYMNEFETNLQYILIHLLDKTHSNDNNNNNTLITDESDMRTNYKHIEEQLIQDIKQFNETLLSQEIEIIEVNKQIFKCRNLVMKSFDNLKQQYQTIEQKLDSIDNKLPQKTSVKQLVNKLSHNLIGYYQSPNESKVTLDIGETSISISVSDLFVNLSIVEEETIRQHENKILQEVHEDLHLIPTQTLPSKGKNKPSSTSLNKEISNQIKLLKKPRNILFDMGIMHDSEGIYSMKKNIKTDSLFLEQTLSNNKKVIPKEILLLGRAGIGKTTLCRYLANRWANGNLWRSIPNQSTSTSSSHGTVFQWIFYLRLKEVANHDKLKNEIKIPYILFHSLWYDCQIPTPEVATELWNYLIGESQDNILFILDGYDEVSDPIHPACERLINIREFVQPNDRIHILTTSRPHAKINKKVDLVLEDIGFLDEDIPKYINMYFTLIQRPEDNDNGIINDINTNNITINTNTNKANLPATSPSSLSSSLSPENTFQFTSSTAQTLYHWLIKRKKIKQICHVPINLELLCNIWIDQKLAHLTQEDLVMSDLYQMMLNKLMKRYLKRKLMQDWNQFESTAIHLDQSVIEHKDCQKALKYLEELALEGFQSGNLVLTKDIFERLRKKYQQDFVESIQHFLEAGFLKSVGNDLQKNPLEKEYYFIHLSFQEYLTARFFARIILTGQIYQQQSSYLLFVQEHRFNPRYQLVWVYVAGIIRTFEHISLGEHIRIPSSIRPDIEGQEVKYFALRSEYGLKAYFKILLPSNSRDLYGVYELELLVRCAEETKWVSCSATEQLLKYLGRWVMHISTLPMDQSHELVLRHLSQLFVTCPMAMDAVKYRSPLFFWEQPRKGLFNFLIYYATSGPWMEFFQDLNKKIFYFLPFMLKTIQTLLTTIYQSIDEGCEKCFNFICCPSLILMFSWCFNYCKCFRNFVSFRFSDDLDDESPINTPTNSFRLKHFLKILFSPIILCILIIGCIIGLTLMGSGVLIVGILLLLPSFLFTVSTGIFPNLSLFALIIFYESFQTSIAKFLSFFRFSDIQVVKRLIYLLQNGEAIASSQLIAQLSPYNFTPELRPLMQNVFHQLILHKDIRVIQEAFQKYILFQYDSFTQNLIQSNQLDRNETKINLNKFRNFLATKLFEYDEPLFLFNALSYDLFLSSHMLVPLDTLRSYKTMNLVFEKELIKYFEIIYELFMQREFHFLLFKGCNQQEYSKQDKQIHFYWILLSYLLTEILSDSIGKKKNVSLSQYPVSIDLESQRNSFSFGSNRHPLLKYSEIIGRLSAIVDWQAKHIKQETTKILYQNLVQKARELGFSISQYPLTCAILNKDYPESSVIPTDANEIHDNKEINESFHKQNEEEIISSKEIVNFTEEFDRLKQLFAQKSSYALIEDLKEDLPKERFSFLCNLITNDAQRELVVQWLLNLARRVQRVRNFHCYWLPMIVIYIPVLAIVVLDVFYWSSHRYLQHKEYLHWFAQPILYLIYGLLFFEAMVAYGIPSLFPGNLLPTSYSFAFWLLFFVCMCFEMISGLIQIFKNIVMTSINILFFNTNTFNKILDDIEFIFFDFLLTKIYQEIFVEASNHLVKLLENEELILGFFTNYPNHNPFHFHSDLQSILRKHLSRHHTAIWKQTSGNTQVIRWYEGRVLQSFHVKNMRQLCRDIESIRLTSERYSLPLSKDWISCLFAVFACGFFGSSCVDSKHSSSEPQEVLLPDEELYAESSDRQKYQETWSESIQKLRQNNKQLLPLDMQSASNPLSSGLNSFSIYRN